ncbi:MULTISPECIES: trypco2 family protein [Streptomyces]|uniref:trypco2 family protein n=1 Tax=Streptomyces TaxID=1883 RepID=UPI001AD841FA|nr:trypco2 family protein [Streptomyces sp. PBH53]
MPRTHAESAAPVAVPGTHLEVTVDIELADLLASLRSEIETARVQAEDEDIRFRIESVDLELHVAVEKTKQAKGGVKFWVLSGDVSGGSKNTRTHVIKLRLSAETKDGNGQPTTVLTGDDVSDLIG